MLAEDTPELPSETKAAVVLAALGGHHLIELLPGKPKDIALRQLKELRGGGWWGYCDGDGIHRIVMREEPTPAGRVMDGWRISWPEVLTIVKRGCGDCRREAYERAYQEYVSWCETGDKPSMRRSKDPEVQRRQKAAEEVRERVVGELHRAELAIVESGCAAEMTQTLLF